MSFYTDPVFIDILLGTLYVMLVLVTLLVVWSAVRSLRLREGKELDWGFPSKRIAWGVAILVVATLAITALLADTTPLVINGKMYTDTLWLRIGDMMIWTSAVLIVVAVVVSLPRPLRRRGGEPNPRTPEKKETSHPRKKNNITQQ